MKTKLPLVLTLTAMTLTLAINARAGHRVLPRDCGPAIPSAAPTDPVESVFDHYLKIQSALAHDSMEGIALNASAISRAVRDDFTKMPSPEIVAEADVLAETKNLSKARPVFKRLSKSLIKYMHNHNVPNAYVEVYCPVTKASWLQRGDKIDNPYLGASNRSCGQIQNKAKQKRS